MLLKNLSYIWVLILICVTISNKTTQMYPRLYKSYTIFNQKKMLRIHSFFLGTSFTNCAKNNVHILHLVFNWHLQNQGTAEGSRKTCGETARVLYYCFPKTRKLCRTNAVSSYVVKLALSV